MSSTSPFKLERATVSDLPELSELMFNCFHPDMTQYYMGAKSVDDLPKFVSKYTKIMNEDPADIWIKITDAQTGEIVSASNWKLYLGPESAIARGRDEVPEWLEGEMAIEASKLMEPLNEARIPANPDPFLYLHICYTSADYRRRGAGSMMMQWANDLADLLFIPGWVEASADGTALYKTFGYYEVGTIDLVGGEQVKAMRRDSRTMPITGGKS